MAFSELERKRIEKTVNSFIEARRPPPAIRNQLNLGFRLRGQSVELFEIRPVWDNPSQKRESPIAKTTYVKTQNIWKVYWMRADLKWHSSRPCRKWKHSMPFLPWWPKTNMHAFSADPSPLPLRETDGDTAAPVSAATAR